MPIAPEPLEISPPGLYAEGHAVYFKRSENAAPLLLEDEIYFVDAANADDPAQDGTFAHPFAGIGQAVAQCRGRDDEYEYRRAIFFVAAGEYREAVILGDGHTLTSALVFDERRLRKLELGEGLRPVFRTRELPRLLAPPGLTPPRLDWVSPRLASAVTLLECSSLRRFNVETAENRVAAAALYTYMGGRAVEIVDNVLVTRGDDAPAVFLDLHKHEVEQVLVTGNEFSTRGARSHGVDLYATMWRDDPLSILELRDNRVEAPGPKARGLNCLLDEGTWIRRLIVRGNDITAAAEGLVIALGDEEHREEAAFLLVSGNVVFSREADGIALRTTHRTTLHSVNILGNEVRGGDRGLALALSGCRCGSLVIADNRVSGAAGGLRCAVTDNDFCPDDVPRRLILARLAALHLTGNRIDAGNGVGLDCIVETDETGSLHIRGNEVAARGEGCRALRLLCSGPGRLAVDGDHALNIADNRLRATGLSACALVLDIASEADVPAAVLARLNEEALSRGNVLQAEGTGARLVLPLAGGPASPPAGSHEAEVEA